MKCWGQNACSSSSGSWTLCFYQWDESNSGVFNVWAISWYIATLVFKNDVIHLLLVESSVMKPHVPSSQRGRLDHCSTCKTNEHTNSHHRCRHTVMHNEKATNYMHACMHAGHVRFNMQTHAASTYMYITVSYFLLSFSCSVSCLSMATFRLFSPSLQSLDISVLAWKPRESATAISPRMAAIFSYVAIIHRERGEIRSQTARIEAGGTSQAKRW